MTRIDRPLRLNPMVSGASRLAHCLSLVFIYCFQSASPFLCTLPPMANTAHPPLSTKYCAIATARRSSKTSTFSSSLALTTKGKVNSPCHYGPALFGTKPNKLLQFDYIDLILRRTGEMYVLMVRYVYSCEKTAANYLVE